MCWGSRMSGLSMFGYDQDLWEWDHTLWHLVQQCANRSPEETIQTFGIQREYASLVAGLSPRQVERLSSGVIASFQPVFDEDSFIALLAEPYDPYHSFHATHMASSKPIFGC